MSEIGYQYDDGGREAEGFGAPRLDCVPRAAAILLGIPYAVAREARGLLCEPWQVDTADWCRAKVATMAWRMRLNVSHPDVIYYAMLGLRRTVHTTHPPLDEVWTEYGECIVYWWGHCSALVDGCLRDVADYRRRKDGTPQTVEWVYTVGLQSERKAE